MIDQAGEMFDLVDERGQPLGRTKLRSLVHRDGDWHRSFHCWVLTPGPGGVPRIVLQLRAPNKETWPRLWDVSVGGHYSAGEGIEGGLREISEELGLMVVLEDLIRIGRRHEQVHYSNGLIDREIQDVYALWRSVRLAELHPDPAEVAGLALVPASELEQLARGRIPSVAASGGPVSSDGTVESTTVELTREALVPASGNYIANIARLARRIGRSCADR